VARAHRRIERHAPVAPRFPNRSIRLKVGTLPGVVDVLLAEDQHLRTVEPLVGVESHGDPQDHRLCQLAVIVPQTIAWGASRRRDCRRQRDLEELARLIAGRFTEIR
jgi:hypothetical protein